MGFNDVPVETFEKIQSEFYEAVMKDLTKVLPSGIQFLEDSQKAIEVLAHSLSVAVAVLLIKLESEKK